jgi:hypothetical protein
LLSAWEINDLWLGSEEEERLWEAFKQNEITVERRVLLREGDQDPAAEVWPQDESYLIDFVALCQRGKLAILCGSAGPLGEGSALRERPSVDYEWATAGWTILRFSPQQVEQSLEECLTSVQKSMDALSGNAID